MSRRRIANSELEFMETLLTSSAYARVLIRTAIRQTNDEDVLDTLADALKELNKLKILFETWLRQTYEAGSIADIDYETWPQDDRSEDDPERLIAALTKALEAAVSIADRIPRQDGDSGDLKMRVVK